MAQTSRTPVLSAAGGERRRGEGEGEEECGEDVASCPGRTARRAARVTDLVVFRVGMDYLARALDAVATWREAAGPVPSHPALDARPGALRGGVGGVQRADGRQLSVPPPALRGADAQAAAPGRDRRLHRGDARQRQQPRARRRAGDERARGRGRARPGRDVRLPGRRARAPDVLGHDRQPRGAVGGARAAPGQGDRLRHRRPLHALADVRGARRSRGSPPTTSTPSRRCAQRPRRDGRRHRRHDRPRHRRRRRARRSRCASATASASTSTPPTAASSRCSTSSSRWRRFRAIADADSVVVDPHKHGLQPYGCGAVLFRDPGVGRLYKHDSPYTYFTSGDLHLGEISLECSRAGRVRGGAVADAALARPRADPGRRRARRARLGGRCCASPTCCACTSSRSSTSSATSRAGRARREIDAASERVLDAGHDRPTTRSSSRRCGSTRAAFAAAHPDVEMDIDGVRVLRSVLMKPEHEPHVPWLHERVTAIARR